jgi:hypothetical protein
MVLLTQKWVANLLLRNTAFKVMDYLSYEINYNSWLGLSIAKVDCKSVIYSRDESTHPVLACAHAYFSQGKPFENSVLPDFVHKFGLKVLDKLKYRNLDKSIL